MNAVTSVFAGFVTFSVLGYMSLRSGVPVSKVIMSGNMVDLNMHIITSSTAYVLNVFQGVFVAQSELYCLFCIII